MFGRLCGRKNNGAMAEVALLLVGLAMDERRSSQYRRGTRPTQTEDMRPLTPSMRPLLGASAPPIGCKELIQLIQGSHVAASLVRFAGLTSGRRHLFHAHPSIPARPSHRRYRQYRQPSSPFIPQHQKMIRLASSRCASAAAAAGRRRLRPAFYPGFQSLSTTSGNKNDPEDTDDDDDMLEWIPPNRPLGGDTGKSHLYVRDNTRQLLSKDDTTNGDDSDVVNLKLSDVELSEIDFDSLDVEPGAVSSGASGLNALGDDDDDDDDDDAFDETPIDIEAYVKKVMAEADMRSHIDLDDDDDDDDDVDGDDEAARREQEELDMLEQEILELERLEVEQAEEWEGRERADNDMAPGGYLDDDPTSLTIDDFVLDQEAELHKEENADTDKVLSDTGPDWLAARRSRLGQGDAKPVGMLSPADADAARQLDSEISVVEYTLLSSAELSTSLSALGAEDIVVIHPGDRYGGSVSLEADGLIVATGRSASHLRVLAESVVRNLRARGLQRRGVIGAMLGPEGGEDIGTSRRNRRKSGGLAGKSVDDGWMIVDCGNYVVHLQDEATRRDIKLESLWQGEEGRKLRSVNMADDDSVDDYVAANPVPDKYARSTMIQSADLLLPNFARGDRWKPIRKVEKKKRGGRRY